MRLDQVTPVLMCGGEGKRLRPLSRRKCPKPFITMFGRGSLFQETLRRVKLLGAPVVLTREDLEDIVLEQAGDIACDMKCVLETCAKNTAPAILKMCLSVSDIDKPLLFLPTDHFIEDFKPLLNAVQKVLDGDWCAYITLFGIAPTYPATRYGYIGQDPVVFHEKPNRDTAQSYIESSYLWNSGMLLASARTILSEASIHAPELLQLVKNDYEAIAPVSFDYEILEKSEIIKCTPVDLIWMDVGTWGSYLSYFWKKHDKTKH